MPETLIKHTDVTGAHVQFSVEQFRYAMYYGEIIGDIKRVKTGRSYALHFVEKLKEE